MRHVLNAIGPDVSAAFGTSYLPDNGAAVPLSPDNAFEIEFGGDPAKALKAARAFNVGRGFDINVVPAANRRKKLLIADMDSTIICCECLDELADIAGVKPRVAAITERAMRGEIPFEAALRERVTMLKGLPLAALERTFAERVQLNPGAFALLATMKAHGASALLVSGGFTYFTARVAAGAGFDWHQANTLLDDGEVLTGEVAEPILGREAKLAALDAAVAELGISHDDVLAVGDGANDLAMIARAGLGVAYHAKPIVAEAAAARIDHGDLTALLYLQGYRQDEFVQPSPSSRIAT
jgi:phosphoserine phosphatase